MRVHLIDGTYELFRAYFGAPKANAPDGREVGAIRGLARSFLGLIRNEGATHIAVAFDHVIESFRNDLFAGYKTGAGIEPDLWAQFELAEQITRALGMVVWPMVEFEADDALATGALYFEPDSRVTQICICSPDKDLAQCVSGQHIVCVDRRRKKTIDEAGVHDKFGVAPKSIPDWLALVGDSSDGIPGIPRWGARSASAMLAEYGHIEHIPGDSGKWSIRLRGARALADSLNTHQSEAALYRQLATLRTDVPIQESLDGLEWQGALGEELEEMCQTLGDLPLLDRVPR